jgi:hypothetical protein
MKTSRKSFYRASVIVALIVTSVIIAFLTWRQKANRPVLIGREQAIQNAIEACNSSYGLESVELPTEFQTELTTYEKPAGSAPIIGSDSGRPAWIVIMKGHWLLVGGPPPASGSSSPTSEPAYWDECTIIIDAKTGESLSTPIE